MRILQLIDWRQKVFAATMIFAVYMSAALVLAQEALTPAQELQVRIAEISEQITQQTTSVEQIQARVKKATAELEIFKSELEKLKAGERELTEELASISKDIEGAQEEIRDLEIQVRERRELSVKRIRATYMHPADQTLSDLFRSSSSPTFSHLGYYLKNVKSYDRRMVDELMELRRSRSEKEVELQKLKRNQERLVLELRGRRAAIVEKVNAQQPLIKRLNAERSEREGALTELNAQLLRFETVLAGLTGGKNEVIGRVGRGKTVESSPNTPFEGQGLEKLRGTLPPPVKGRVVVPFGREIQAKNGIAGRSKGLEFEAPEGTSVVAVAAGKVIFVGRMPVLGSIVIVDHGERYYSLYGKLAAISIATGAEVGRDNELGTLVAGEPGMGNFYFEIRKDGTPVNPQPFLKAPKRDTSRQ